MPTTEQFLEEIEREFSGARRAAAEGNEGKARVCARRAAGAAIAWFLASFPREGWGTDAMQRVRRAATEESFPADVREAADRLTAKITGEFGYSSGGEPEADARLIVLHVRSAVEGGRADTR